MTTPSQPPEELKGFEALVPGTYATSGGSELSYSYTSTSQHKPGAPILVLLHGWPQTRYIWRYLVPELAGRGYTLFVPDLPGYGYSTMMATTVAVTTTAEEGEGGEDDFSAKSAHDRTNVGFAVLSAVRAVYGSSNSSSSASAQGQGEGKGEDELQVVLIGHDRGGRVAQRLITSSSSSPTPSPSSPSPPSLPIAHALRIQILGAVLLDIVPYAAQWSAHANPRSSTRYFHWTFLPSPFSIPMVQAYGSGRFCREVISAAAGNNEAGRETLYADGAVEHYVACYEREEVVRGAVADYSAGAAEDWDAQREDLEKGRKIHVPVTVLHCEGLESMHGDVEAVWKQWAGEGARLEVHKVGGGVGHYLPEEAPEETNRYILDFLKGLGL
ncbi:Alpha/Beta hydrolase protein [Nemania sp. FL0916]|nr:Alpha/Beta hydrolase protein [Nemania sp. FL0916]